MAGEEQSGHQNDISLPGEINPTGNDEAPSRGVVSLMPLPSRPRYVERPEPVEPQEAEEIEVVRKRSAAQLEKARKRQETYLQKRREKKKRKIFYNRLRALLRVFSACVLLIALYLFARSPYFTFHADSVQLTGQNLLRTQQLARFITPYDNRNLFLINPLEIQQAILKESTLVEKVYVRRSLLPPSMNVAVTEKPSWGILYSGSPLTVEEQIPVPGSQEESANSVEDKPLPSKPQFLLHWDGTKTDLADFALTPQQMTALNHPIPIVSSKPDMDATALTRYRKLAHLLNQEPDAMKLRYLDVNNPYDIYAHFDGFLVRVGRVDNSLNRRMARLHNLLPAIRQHQHTLRYVDLRWNQQIIFKKKSEAEIKAEQQRAEQRAKQKAHEERLKLENREA